MPTTMEQAREALVVRIQDAATLWTEYPLVIEYDNVPAVNQDTQTNPYLRVTIVYDDGYQIGLAKTAGHRLLGNIVLEAMVKEGSGRARANVLLQHFYPRVHMTDLIPPLRTLAARFGSKPAKDGWVAQAAIIPFWYDSMP